MNEQLRPELRDYLEGGAHNSLLLIGSSGMGMMDDALKVSSALLGSESPEICQDYMKVVPEDGGLSLGVDTAEKIIARSQILPAVAQRQVILIDGFDKMTIPAQNKLLKLVEETETVVIIAVAYEDTVLPTMKSRMNVVRYTPLSLEQFIRYCEKTAIEDPLVTYYLTGGNINSIGSVDTDSEIFRIFGQVRRILDDEGIKGLGDVMFVLHMIKEKDRQAFFECHREMALKMLSLITHCVVAADGITEGTARLLESYNKDAQRVSSPAYTKDDFMAFFVNNLQ